MDAVENVLFDLDGVQLPDQLVVKKKLRRPIFLGSHVWPVMKNKLQLERFGIDILFKKKLQISSTQAAIGFIWRVFQRCKFQISSVSINFHLFSNFFHLFSVFNPYLCSTIYLSIHMKNRISIRSSKSDSASIQFLSEKE